MESDIYHDLLLVEAGRLAGASAEVVDAPLAEAVAEVELTVELGERGQRTLTPEASTLTTRAGRRRCGLGSAYVEGCAVQAGAAERPWRRQIHLNERLER